MRMIPDCSAWDTGWDTGDGDCCPTSVSGTAVPVPGVPPGVPGAIENQRERNGGWFNATYAVTNTARVSIAKKPVRGIARFREGKYYICVFGLLLNTRYCVQPVENKG